jgi:rod shape-determining protein MreC
VLIERSRAQGVVVGTGAERLQMQFVSDVADVGIGDVVVSSGIDGIYPKGFTVGRVESVEKSGPSYKRIIVKPAVDFSALEDVLVVTTPPPARDAGERPGGVPE